MTLGDRLRTLRQEKGLTLKEVGNCFKLGKTTVANYEKDERKPDYEMIIKFADFYNVTVDYLVGTSEYREKTSMKEADKLALLKQTLVSAGYVTEKEIGKISDEKAEQLLDVLRTTVKLFKQS